MSHPYYHAQSSARRHGGVAEDYLALHEWFDETKAHMPDPRHRALRHHSEGIYLAVQVFGTTIPNRDGKAVPTRILGEQHVREDLGYIPTVKDWLQHMTLPKTLNRPQRIEQTFAVDFAEPQKTVLNAEP
ncbi:MAG: hypothetical protein AAFX76_09290 [Planctomycetota bacterium]